MKFCTVIYSLLLATLCMGCGARVSMRQLEQLDLLVNDTPDSVLAVPITERSNALERSVYMVVQKITILNLYLSIMY